MRLNPFLQRPCCFWLNYIPTGGDDCDAVILPCRYIQMRKHFLQPLGESLCQLFYCYKQVESDCLNSVTRWREGQNIPNILSYIVIQCHDCITQRIFYVIFLYFAYSHAISLQPSVHTQSQCNDTRIHLNKGIRHIKILHYHIHFCRNAAFVSPFYD